MLTRRQRRAARTPKGATPFSNPRLFAGSSRRTKKKNGANSKGSSGLLPLQGVGASYSRGVRTAEPKFLTRSSRSVRIAHRELVGSIIGSAAFATPYIFDLNPGISATFPWLSSQAVGWEQYKFHRLKFCYYTRTGTSTPGSVMLIPDYDPADFAPVSEQIASAYRDAVEEAPWVPEFSCNLDPSAMLGSTPRKYIRAAPLAANLDIKTYDSGSFFVGTSDGTAVPWGKLWVEYDVELFVPQVPSFGVGNLTGQHSEVIATTTGNLTANITNFAETTPTLCLYDSNGGLTFFLPGVYLVTMIITAVTSATQSVAPTPLGSASLITTYNNPSGYFTAGSGTTKMTTTVVVKTVVPGTDGVKFTVGLVGTANVEFINAELAANFG